jgi:hypothetical protein
MKWLKDWLFSRNLNNRLKALKNVKKESKNLSSYIGILVDQSSIDSITSLEKVIKDWEGKGKKVEKFAYLDVKVLEEESSIFFCQKDINWVGIPASPEIENFIQTPFDILITINPTHRNFIHYINAVSVAKFKIGLEADDLEYNNLIIDCKEPGHVQTAFKDIQITLDKLAI